MRISILPDDPGYLLNHYNLKIWFNGELIKGCITADEEKGEVLAFVYDEKGHVVVEDEHAKTAIRHGQVTIVTPPGWYRVTPFKLN